MTITQLLAEADRGRHAKADYQLESSFRNRIWPRFLTDIDIAIGNTAWRERSDGQVEFAVNTHSAVLPSEVGRVNRAWISGPATTANGLGMWVGDVRNLIYIGESANEIATATERLTRTTGGVAGASPSRWWLELQPYRGQSAEADADGGTAEEPPPNAGWMLRLDWPVAEATTVRFVYQLGSSLEDTVTFPVDYDLNRLIPHQYQWALISLQRADILADRYSDGDERFAYESGVYSNFLKSLQKRPDPGPGGQTRVTFR